MGVTQRVRAYWTNQVCVHGTWRGKVGERKDDRYEDEGWIGKRRWWMDEQVGRKADRLRGKQTNEN